MVRTSEGRRSASLAVGEGSARRALRAKALDAKRVLTTSDSGKSAVAGWSDATPARRKEFETCGADVAGCGRIAWPL